MNDIAILEVIFFAWLGYCLVIISMVEIPDRWAGWVTWRAAHSEVRKRWEIGRLTIGFSFRSSHTPTGRFGGGWNLNLGVQIGGLCIIFSLLVCEIRVSWTRSHPFIGWQQPSMNTSCSICGKQREHRAHK